MTSHAFRLPSPDLHPGAVAAKLLTLPEFEHLVAGEATIEWLLRSDEKIRAGRRVLGTACMPSVKGELSECFEWMLENLFGAMPTFLIVLDASYWTDEADDLQREILVYHELCHCTQKRDSYGTPRFNNITGEPIWGIAGHDVEEFNAVVSRYGAHSEDIRAFIAAAQSHDALREH